MPMVVALDHLLHGLDFAGCQTRGDDSRTTGLIIQFAPRLGTTPAVVARCREARDSERRVQRQDLSCTLNRPQQDSLGIAFGKPLVVELGLRYPKHGDQQANHRSEQGRSMS